MIVTGYETTQRKAFSQIEIAPTTGEKPTLRISNLKQRTIEGFGCCFNELGYQAIQGATPDNQKHLLDQLFAPDGDLRLNLCRMPVGANDYARDWYSFDETPGDLSLAHFSIDRDQELLIPYIYAALRRNPNLILTACPWSPPTWMKTQPVYNFGQLIWEPRVLTAYANYLVKFIRAYQAAGITINQLHVQNEVRADQKFPSCQWTGVQLRDFIRDYLGPAFVEAGLKTEIWLGTLNAPENYHDDFDYYANLVLRDPVASAYISGVGYQWAGKNAIRRNVEAFPEKRYLQTESECGDGTNSWDYAEYIFSLFRHYLVNGANGYIYWNAVLAPGGMSTWGWHQNAMITVDAKTHAVTYHPEYYVMKHFSHFIRPGASRLDTTGVDSSQAVAFENPDGSRVVALFNRLDTPVRSIVENLGHEYVFTINAHAFQTLLFK